VRKRLRKKLRRGEFLEYGFDVECHFRDGVTLPDVEEVLARSEAISHTEPGREGLCVCMGGGPHGGFAFATYCPRPPAGRYGKRHHNCGSCTEEHREIVIAWLRSEPLVSSFTVGPLVDARRSTYPLVISPTLRYPLRVRPSLDVMRIALRAAAGNLARAAAALGVDRGELAQALGIVETRGRPATARLTRAAVDAALTGRSERQAAEHLGVARSTLRSYRQRSEKQSRLRAVTKNRQGGRK
jgi:uncharacterized protein YggL (DUF469 family)/DNA-binding protein Fis